MNLLNKLNYKKYLIAPSDEVSEQFAYERIYKKADEAFKSRFAVLFNKHSELLNTIDFSHMTLGTRKVYFHSFRYSISIRCPSCKGFPLILKDGKTKVALVCGSEIASSILDFKTSCEYSFPLTQQLFNLLSDYFNYKHRVVYDKTIKREDDILDADYGEGPIVLSKGSPIRQFVTDNKFRRLLANAISSIEYPAKKRRKKQVEDSYQEELPF